MGVMGDMGELAGDSDRKAKPCSFVLEIIASPPKLI